MTKTTYIETNINLSENQKQKIASAYKNKTKTTVNFKPEDVNGGDTFYFTKGQLSRLEKAFNAGKGVNINLSNAQIRYNTKHGGFIPVFPRMIAKTLTTLMRMAANVLPTAALPHIAYAGRKVKGRGNNTQDGGFLGALGKVALRAAKPFAKHALKPLAKGALGAAGSHIADAILGDGLYLVKNGNGLKLETDGSGLFIPIASAIGGIGSLLGKAFSGNGLYLVQDGQVQHGGFLAGLLPGAVSEIVSLIS